MNVKKSSKSQTGRRTSHPQRRNEKERVKESKKKREHIREEAVEDEFLGGENVRTHGRQTNGYGDFDETYRGEKGSDRKSE